MGTTHSRIGASSRSRWKACPGSIRQCEGVPKPQPGIHAQTGTHFHEVASSILLQVQPRDFYLLSEEPLGFEAAMVYVDLIESECKNAHYLVVEHHFDLSALHPGMFGTADAVAYFEKEKLLRVYDYKHGTSPVDVEDNEQLLYYAIGALLSLSFPVTRVELVVVQPRSSVKRDGKIKRWGFDLVPKIFDYIQDLLDEVLATEKPDAPLVAGDHCFFCPAVASCPAQLALRVAKAQNIFDDGVLEQQTIKPEVNHGNAEIQSELSECF